jgi:hypothetical protein
MANRLAYIALIFVVASCAAPKVVIQQRDSTVIHIKDSLILRDSIIFVPIPMGEDKAKLPDTDTSFLQTSVAESEAFVKDGILHHSLRNRAEAVIPIRVTIPERIRTEDKGLIRYLKTVERIEVKKELSRWQKFIMTIGYSFLIAVLGWLIWKLSKFFM